MNYQTEISSNSQQFIIKHTLSQTSITILNTVFKRFIFQSFDRRGKYPEMKYSYNHDEKSMTFIYNKRYTTQIMHVQKMQLIHHAKYISINFEEFIGNLKTMVDRKIFKDSDCKLVRVDTLGMILMKTFTSISWKGEPIIQRLFLKFSPYEFRRYLPYKINKDCDQSFSCVWRQEFPKAQFDEEEKMDEQFTIPSESQFYKSPRIAYIDDLIFTNDSLAKRFNRFLAFYQAHSIFMDHFNVDHQYLREFYQKCISRSMISSMRLKKITFDYKFTKVQKQKDKGNQREKQVKSGEKYREHLVSLSLFSIDEQCTKSDSPHNSFSIELISELQNSDKIFGVQQYFFQHLHKSFNENTNLGNPNMFIDVCTQASVTMKTVQIKNQLGFCQLLSHLSFFIDRLAFKSVLKETPLEYHVTSITNPTSVQNLEEQAMHFRTPSSEQFKSKKYLNSYCLQIRSQYNYQNSNIMDETHFQNTIHKIIIMRKVLAKKQKQYIQNLELSCISEQYKESMRGLILYVNEVLKKWNARDCYNDLNSFVANYLNIIVDKNKEKSDKSLFKNTMQWKQIIDGLSALIESLTRIFIAPDYAVLFHFLRTYQEDKISQQVSIGEQVMFMTIKILRITSAGWIQIVPSCVYFFEMQRDQTFFFKKGQEKVELAIKSSKDQIQRAFSAYLKRTMKSKGLSSFFSRNL